MGRLALALSHFHAGQVPRISPRDQQQASLKVNAMWSEPHLLLEENFKNFPCFPSDLISISHLLVNGGVLSAATTGSGLLFLKKNKEVKGSVGAGLKNETSRGFAAFKKGGIRSILDFTLEQL